MHPNPMRLTFRPDRPKRVYFMSQPPCGPDTTSHSNRTQAYDPGSTAAPSPPAITLEGTSPQVSPRRPGADEPIAGESQLPGGTARQHEHFRFSAPSR